MSNAIDLTTKVLHLYGGFAGNETSLSDRKPSENVTKLNANNTVSRVLKISTSSTVDGFTVTGATTGGIYIYSSSSNPTIANCTITGNTSTTYGGGIYISNGNPIITNCAITGNTAGTANNQGYGGGIYIYSSGNPTITNCTITGNTAGTANNQSYGGGIYISSANLTITNCTIVNNQAKSSGNEIYYSNGEIKLKNTLVWNTDNVIAKYTNGNGTISYDHCAYPNATGENNISFDWGTDPVSSDTGLYLANDNPVLLSLVGMGVSDDTTPQYDQIGNLRSNPPSIGAVEINLPVLSVDITGVSAITAKYGIVSESIFVAVVSLDNEASTGHTISWDVSINPAASTISIDQNGKLTVNNTTLAGTYTATVNAQATRNLTDTLTIHSNTAQKNVTVTVQSADMNLTLTKNSDFPSGKVGTAYSQQIENFFTLTGTPTGASTSWSIHGNLPDGLSLADGKISGTPTNAGTFDFSVVVTATAENYNTESKDVAASITVNAADSPTPQPAESMDMNLTLTKNSDFPAGKVGTAYSQQIENFFTLTGAPEGASTSWSIHGNLPDGLSYSNSNKMISGTPTAAGTFNFTVRADVTADNYNAASKDVTASITVNDADSGTDPETTIVSPENGISGLDTEKKKAATTLILTEVNDLSKITMEEFPSLTTVEISSDADVGNGGNLDLSGLSGNITTFVINENKNVKSLNISGSNSSIEKIEAQSCDVLESVDVSGNNTIVSIDVKGSGSLSVLNAENCAKLQYIDCSNCKITDISIGQCPELLNIDCSHNRLLALDVNSADMNLTKLKEVKCAVQEFKNWRSSAVLNFDSFVISPDVVANSDDASSLSSVADTAPTKLSNVENLTAYDEGGDPIEIITSDDSGNITFASAPYVIKYDYNIGFNNTSMDVMVSALEAESTGTAGGSGGGCNSGFFGTLSCSALGLLALFTAGRKNAKNF